MEDVAIMRERIKASVDHLDEDTLKKIFLLLSDEVGTEDEISDSLADLSPEQEASLMRGIKDADEGRLTAHEDVMKKYQQWLTR